MGFNIGRFLGKIAGPVLGGIIGGPSGGALSTAVSAGFDEPAKAATVGRATQPGPISPSNINIVAPAGFGGAPSSIAPSFASLARLPAIGRDVGIGLGLGQLPSIFGGGNGQGNQVQRILAKARQATGGPVTRNRIIDAAKVCGLDIAARTFGLGVEEVCMVVVKGRTRRRRGVSAADIRRTKRTIGFAAKIRKDLKALAK